MAKGHPIAPLNPAHKGAFHKEVGKAPGAPITAADIAKGKAAGGLEEKRAVFAENAKGWNHAHHVEKEIAHHEKHGHGSHGHGQGHGDL